MSREQAEDAVKILLQYLGVWDLDNEEVRGTPSRVVRAWKEMTSGYKESPKDILGTVFPDSYDEIVVLRGIPFVSNCLHHLLPFTGTVDIGYIPSPGKGVVGLSKLARLVDCFSKRLQLQERLTRQIADSILEHLDAEGVAVVVAAEHSCLSCRGVKKTGAKMITSAMLGSFRDDPTARAEFLSLVGK